MVRIIITLMLLALPGTSLVATQSTPVAREMRDMPVLVLYCSSDPGRLNVGGGKDPAPQTLIDSGLCTPAEGVALTFVLANDDWNFESKDPHRDDWHVHHDSWFARCDTDTTGSCALNSPVGFDIMLGVSLHESTVKPGYVPAFFQLTTHNFTEFAGYGLALIPADPGTTPARDVQNHQTLALNITHNGKPGSILTEWEIDGHNHTGHHDGNDHHSYLATNAEGWVSGIVAANDEVEIEFVNIRDHATITASCSAIDDANAQIRLKTEDDEIELHIPDTSNDIRCDVNIQD